MLPALALLTGVFVAAWLLTGACLRYAIGRRLYDMPNPRGSHAIATPRGGGIAIALILVAVLPVLALLGTLTWAQAVGLIGGGMLVAVIGFGDDHGHVEPYLRLLGHFAAAAWMLWWFRGVPPLPVLGTQLDLGWLRLVLAATYLVWLLNLTNFMDGIDGIAGVETITVCLGGALVHLVAMPASPGWLPPVMLASASLGFLRWNWPPAQIFMGDAGSGFVGLMLGAFSLQAAQAAPALFWAWLVLLGVFIVDATVTLVRRLARMEKVYEAHRTHAYQHAAQRCAAHRPVTVAVAAINVCWLLPLAVLIARGSLDGLTGVAIAYLPLTVVACWLGAGAAARENQART